jgi:hypothetical protein
MLADLSWASTMVRAELPAAATVPDVELATLVEGVAGELPAVDLDVGWPELRALVDSALRTRR